MSTKPNPVIFIHGLWIHASAWQPWMDLFTERGYDVSAPGWPGDADTVAATRDNADALNDVGIGQVVDHYAQLIVRAAASTRSKPIVVGHSFGGLIAQELLAGGHAAAAVAIDPAPIKGVKALPLAQLRSAFPVLGNPANRHRTVSLTAQAVPLRLRQRPQRSGVRCPARPLDDPRSRPPAVRGRRRQLRPALARRGGHPSGRPRTAAAHLGHRGPHRAAEGHQGGLRPVRRRATPTPSSTNSRDADTR